MQEKGCDRDQQQCHGKAKELQQAYQKLLEQNSPVLSAWDTFLQAFMTIFYDLHRIHMAEAALRKLHQGQRLTTSYSTHFQWLMADVEWNEATQLYQFR
ncbi:hypothetical protein UY3_06661 [Chelonia mydas]|uniref:Retrotransposon gag domain-containing protein n=1 Tax=Chelonia mydas TaxID=8469 RepID=M7BG04_CHEMY|nr:hypothetical protein UY3_06661 [Chelonia mydas]